jgi:hypothetical protein
MQKIQDKEYGGWAKKDLMDQQQFSQTQEVQPTLRLHLAALGDFSEFRLAHQTGIPYHAIERALDGYPIARSYADRIAQHLSHEYQRDIQASDIAGLVTFNPGREQTSNNDPESR